MPIHSSPDRDQWITVAQVCVRNEVLVYHCCRAIRCFGAFARFIGCADCTFATVERRKNAMIRPSGATSLSKQYKIIGNGQEKDTMVDLAETIIDP